MAWYETIYEDGRNKVGFMYSYEEPSYQVKIEGKVLPSISVQYDKHKYLCSYSTYGFTGTSHKILKYAFQSLLSEYEGTSNIVDFCVHHAYKETLLKRGYTILCEHNTELIYTSTDEPNKFLYKDTRDFSNHHYYIEKSDIDFRTTSTVWNCECESPVNIHKFDGTKTTELIAFSVCLVMLNSSVEIAKQFSKHFINQ